MEFAALGTAGEIYYFRDQIRKGNPDGFFVMNSDVCCNFPLKSIIDFHTSKTSEGVTVVTTSVSGSVLRSASVLQLQLFNRTATNEFN